MDAILTDPGAVGLLHGALLVLAAAGGFLLGAAGFAAGWCLARGRGGMTASTAYRMLVHFAETGNRPATVAEIAAGTAATPQAVENVLAKRNRGRFERTGPGRWRAAAPKEGTHHG
jgi:hypothetical protein